MHQASRTGLLARLIAEGAIVLFVGLWWLTARGLPDYVLPGPVVVAERVIRLFVDPAFLGHTLTSAARVVGSVLLATALGLVLALLAERVPIAAHAVHRRLMPLLNAFPSVAWAILAVIWFQVSNLSVMFVQVMILIPFCLVNVAEGLRAIDAEIVEMGRSFTRSRWRLLRRVVLPLLLPYIMAAIRMAYGIGWKIALVSELFGARSGLGALMLRAQISADAATVFATCLVIVIISLAGERLVIEPLARRVRSV
jgi:NitT/TauT family transport system permease protein/sulfonate transport system permease protein